jgi:hypothetical protein
LRLPKKHEHNTEREPLLSQQKATDASAAPEKTAAPKIREVLTYQTTLNLFVYTLLALYVLAYDLVRPSTSSLHTH